MLRSALIAVCLAGLLGGTYGLAQQAAPSRFYVRPIEPPDPPLPSEAESSAVTRFSFVVYGDTRSPVDGRAPQPDHGVVIDRMLAKIRERASTPFPIRFVLQTGDAVTRGAETAQWSSFTPLIEKLTRGAGLPYFFTLGNHDVPSADAGRTLGLHHTLSAMSKLVPPEGSPRRLSGTLAYAFGFGSLFAIAIDSNTASDRTQLAWVTDQLELLDRTRYRHVVAFFHHPILSSGPHGGSASGRSAAGGDSVEAQTADMRNLYQPLFRKHHVRMTLTGHDHLFDHWIERFMDRGTAYRMDHVVTGGGGAPIYTYRGEPEVAGYLAAGAGQNIRLDHPMRPGATAAENPHHFVIVQVDGDRLSLEVVGIGPGEFQPYRGRSRVELNE